MASDSLYQALNTLSNISLNMSRAAHEKEKLRHLERMQLQNQRFKENYQKQRDDYTLRLDVLKNTRETNYDQISSLGEELKIYTGQANDLKNLYKDKKFQTEGGEKTLEEMGLEIGNDWQVRMDIEKEADDILDTMTNQIDIQRMIIDDLSKRNTKIEQVKQLTNKVAFYDEDNPGNSLLEKAVRGVDDFQRFVEENRDDPNTEEIEGYFAAEPDQYLEQAFMSLAEDTRKADVKTHREARQAHKTELDIEAKELALDALRNPQEVSEISEVFRGRMIDFQRTQSKFNLSINNISGQPNNTEDYEFMNALGGVPSLLKGDKDMYESRRAASDLKDELTNGILGVLNLKGTKIEDEHLKDLIAQATTSFDANSRDAFMVEIARYMLPNEGTMGDYRHGFSAMPQTKLGFKDGKLEEVTNPGYNIGWHGGLLGSYQGIHKPDDDNPEGKTNDPEALMRDEMLYTMLASLTDVHNPHPGLYDPAVIYSVDLPEDDKPKPGDPKPKPGPKPKPSPAPLDNEQVKINESLNQIKANRKYKKNNRRMFPVGSFQ